MNSNIFPTIEESGFETLKISNLNKLNRTTFKNGSIEKINDEEYIFSTSTYIYSKNNDGKIEICKLNKNFEVIHCVVLDLPKTISEDILEDSKLIYHNGLIYCAYTECFNHNQMLVVLDTDFNILREISLKYGNNHTCPTHTTWAGCKKWEKNWNFFFHDDKLYFIYSIYGHNVVELDLNNGDIINTYNMDINLIPKEYDNYFLHSGSPPKLYDENHYITFFHNWDKSYNHNSIASSSRPYRISAYLFENKPPFHIKKMTTPLIFGSPYNTSIPIPEIIPNINDAKVVFAGGMILKDDYMLVSVGVNDIETKLVKIYKNDIIKNILSYDFKI